MIHSTRGRGGAVTALGVSLALATALAAGTPALASTAPVSAPSSPAASTAAVRIPAPTVVPGWPDLGGDALISLLVSVDLPGLPATAELGYEYRLDRTGAWLTDGATGASGGQDQILAPATPGRHAIEVRVTGTVDGATVVGAASAPLDVRSAGRPLDVAPVVVVDGASVTFRWDLRPALNGTTPEENAVYYQVADGPPVDAGVVGSVTVTPGYGRVVAFDLTYGPVPDYWRYVHVEAATDPAPGARPLTRTPLPSVVGTVEVGATLSVRTGTWLPAPVELGYQWFRDGERMPWTEPTHVVDAYDIGHRITVAVRGSRDGYVPVVRTSGPTKVVARPIITPAFPRITGNPTVGRTLTAQPGLWRPASLTLQYKWKRDGTAIPGATARTYVLTPADRGRTVTVTAYAVLEGWDFQARNSPWVRVR